LKILLVDDHALVLEGLKHFLASQGIEVVGTARNSIEALMQYEMLQPDVVLMDIQMVGCDGIQATRMIKKDYPDAKIIMLTAFEDEENLLAAFQAGAEGYLLKTMEPESFLRQLTGMNAGESPIAPHLVKQLLHKFIQYKENTKLHTLSGKNLTDRQQEVLQLLTQGLTYREIAIQLKLKEATVKYHIKELLTKFGLSNRTQLITYTLRNDLVKRK
jgi:two-component system NarL family response regulator